MIFTILFMKYSGCFSHIFWEEIQTFVVIQHLPPTGSSELKDIRGTMDLNKMNKINTGSRCKAFNMKKNNYGNGKRKFEMVTR